MPAKPETAAPTDSAPNTAREKAWRDEIHKPAAEYNANVPCDAIEPDPKNRDKIDKDRVSAMAVSIKEVGLLQPVVLRDLGGGKYRLIAGEHRWRAHLELKLKTIAARIYKGQSDLDAAKKKAVENAQRVDLTPIERAKRFKELAELGSSQKEIGVLFGGVSQPVVANAMRLLELPESVQAQVGKGELSEAHGVGLVRFARWPKACEFVAGEVLRYGWSSKNLIQTAHPFFAGLVSKGILTKIRLKANYWEADELVYQLPRHFGSHADFVVAGDFAYYFHPADPKQPNVWEPEKKKQDEERAVKKAQDQKRAETEAKKSGKSKPSKQQLERKKKLDGNKQARSEIDGTLAHAVLELKGAKGVHRSALAVICDHVLGGADVATLDTAAAAIGLKLPGKLDDAGFGQANGALRDLGEEQMIKLAAAAIILGESEHARKYAGEVPESSAFIAGKAAKSGSIKVTVRSKGGDYIAKAGEAKASSTSAAAAKHFSCKESQVQLLDMAAGADEEDAGANHTFTATKGGK